MLSNMTTETKKEFIKDAKARNISILNAKNHIAIKLFIIVITTITITNYIAFIKMGPTEQWEKIVALSFGCTIAVIFATTYISNNTSSINIKEIKRILNQKNIKTDVIHAIKLYKNENVTCLTVKDIDGNTYDITVNKQFEKELRKQFDVNNMNDLTITIAVKDDKLIHYNID